MDHRQYIQFNPVPQLRLAQYITFNPNFLWPHICLLRMSINHKTPPELFEISSNM